MIYRLTGKWVVVASLATAMASACAGDPPKRSVRGGDGGEGGNDAGGLSPGGEPSSLAGAPGTIGDAGQGGQLVTATAGAGGVAAEQGGMPAAAGSDNEPTAGTPGVLPQCEGNLVFADPYVDQLVHVALDTNGPITSADVANLTEISIPFNDDDVDLTGVECLSGLTTLDLGRGLQDGMEVLASLPNLRTLIFDNPYGVDLPAIGAATQLTSLDLPGLRDGDLSELAKLTNLQHLNLFGAGPFSQAPVDITPLGALTELKSLDVGYVIIADGAPLASLTKLESLSLNNATIASIAPVLGLTNLVSLNLAGTKISTIPDLSAFTKLTTLDISYNTFTDFTPLASHTILTSLNVSSTTLQDLTSIAPLTSLVTLNVSYNELTDVTALGTLPAIQTLDLSFNTGVTSVHPLVTSDYINAGDTVDVTSASGCSTPFVTDVQAIKDKNVTVANACGI